MDYTALKTLHMTLALLSIGGFVIRWLLMFRSGTRPQSRFARIAPHIIDTLFLASGIMLAFLLEVNPLDQHWLLAKLAALPVYILLAALSYQPQRSREGKLALFVAALTVFAWIVSVARLKTAWGFIALI